MSNYDEKIRYEHLLTLPHHQSSKRKHMSMVERAAQFGAFRALTGYEDAICETGRITDKKIELDDYQKKEIDLKIRYIAEHMGEMPQISVTYFVPDEKKQGGEYTTHTGFLQKINYYKKKIIFNDGTEVFVNEILSIVGKIFDCEEF